MRRKNNNAIHVGSSWLLPNDVSGGVTVLQDLAGWAARAHCCRRIGQLSRRLPCSDSNFQILLCQFLARRGRTTSTTYISSAILKKQSVALEGKYGTGIMRTSLQFHIYKLTKELIIVTQFSLARAIGGRKGVKRYD
jgi:hypothetical protein